jgi:hypothetical protein
MVYMTMQKDIGMFFSLKIREVSRWISTYAKVNRLW